MASRSCWSRCTCRPTGFPGLLATDLEHNSLYDLLTQRYATPIARVREALEPVLLRRRDAELLKRPARSPALLVEGIAYSTDGTPIEFGRTYVRGDRTRYYVERVVVRASWESERSKASRDGRVGRPRCQLSEGGARKQRVVDAKVQI